MTDVREDPGARTEQLFAVLEMVDRRRWGVKGDIYAFLVRRSAGHPEGVRASVREISRWTGCARSWVYVVVGEMVDQRVVELLEAGRGSRAALYRINPDARRWRRDVPLRVDPEVITVRLALLLAGVEDIETFVRGVDTAASARALEIFASRFYGRDTNPVLRRGGDLAVPGHSVDLPRTNPDDGAAANGDQGIFDGPPRHNGPPPRHNGGVVTRNGPGPPAHSRAPTATQLIAEGAGPPCFPGDASRRRYDDDDEGVSTETRALLTAISRALGAPVFGEPARRAAAATLTVPLDVLIGWVGQCAHIRSPKILVDEIERRSAAYLVGDFDAAPVNTCSRCTLAGTPSADFFCPGGQDDCPMRCAP